MPELTGPVARARVLVSGLVQGVFFRQSCYEEAARRGVAGWVRNTPDGRVEAVFEGPRGAVDELVAWCRTGPPLAKVGRVEVVEEPPEGLDAFRIR